MSAPEPPAPTPGPPAHPGLREDILRAPRPSSPAAITTRCRGRRGRGLRVARHPVSVLSRQARPVFAVMFEASSACARSSRRPSVTSDVRMRARSAASYSGRSRISGIGGSSSPSVHQNEHKPDARPGSGSGTEALSRLVQEALEHAMAAGHMRRIDARIATEMLLGHDAGCEPLSARRTTGSKTWSRRWWTSSCAGSGRRRAARSWRGLARGGRDVARSLRSSSACWPWSCRPFALPKARPRRRSPSASRSPCRAADPQGGIGIGPGGAERVWEARRVPPQVGASTTPRGATRAMEADRQ